MYIQLSLGASYKFIFASHSETTLLLRLNGSQSLEKNRLLVSHFSAFASLVCATQDEKRDEEKEKWAAILQQFLSRAMVTTTNDADVSDWIYSFPLPDITFPLKISGPKEVYLSTFVFGILFSPIPRLAWLAEPPKFPVLGTPFTDFLLWNFPPFFLRCLPVRKTETFPVKSIQRFDI